MRSTILTTRWSAIPVCGLRSSDIMPIILSNNGDWSTGYLGEPPEHFSAPVNVVSSGWSIWRWPRCEERKASDIFGIEQVTCGKAHFFQDGKRNIVNPGEVYILRLGVNHRYEPLPGKFLHKRHLTLTGPSLGSLLRSMGLWGLDVVRPIQPLRIAKIMKAINMALMDMKPGVHFQASILSYQLLLELSKSVMPRYPEPLQKTLDFISVNLNKYLSINELCKQSGLGPTHLSRLFKAHLNSSPVEYFLKEKFAWARHLLYTTNMAIKEIAAVLGYEDPLYFSAQFKKRAGVSPRNFRQGGALRRQPR